MESNVVRYEGKWFKIVPKAYEPEMQTNAIVWAQLREPLLATEEVYRNYYTKQREDVKVLYPSFRKENVD